MVAAVKTDQIETIMRKQPERRHRIQIEQHLCQSVAQPMPGLPMTAKSSPSAIMPPRCWFSCIHPRDTGLANKRITANIQ